ncbi:hypothetical protein NT6N_29450 [Oceaniferula spumae]|uniref:HEAT repeat domain-containing protein n=1 Tax=Oceaniferula spumae TaxID=2979115 RepID=A0AAT9FPI3_9BACT
MNNLTTEPDMHTALWSLVRNNNKLFSQKRNLEKFRTLLNIISENGTIEDLINIMSIFLYGNNAQKELIENTCLPCLRKLPCEDLPKLDERLRSSISYAGWNINETTDWKQKPSLFELCILACHPNGYTRERAVTALANHYEPVALAIALIRCNDWVSPIRISARDTAVNIIARINTDELMKVWIVFDRVSHGQRHGDISLSKTLFPLLRERIPSNELHLQLESGNSRTRRYAAEVMWHTHQSLNYSDLQALCACSDPYVCFRTMRDILPRLDQRVRTKLLDLVKTKKWAPARLERLRLLMTDQPECMHDELLDALCDRSASVRNFARFHLKEHSDVDMELHYQRKLESPNISTRIAALAGLTEIGSPIVADHAKRWLKEENPRIVAAGLSALPAEVIDNCEDHILKKVTNHSLQISKAAYIALCNSPPLSAKITPYFQRDDLSERQSIYFANLLLLQSRWEAVAHAISFCRHNSKEVNKCGVFWLQRWVYGERKFWMTPSKSDLQDIHRELELSHSNMTEALMKEIRFLLDSYQ